MPFDLSPEVLNLSLLIAYQADAIVSRQLLRAEGGNITLFAFAQGQELSEHTTPYHAFVQILDGEADITIAGQHFHLWKGQAILLPANQPHAVKAASPFKMLLTMVKP
ncbi:MAG: cupin domain-containing protein [Anaerolineales bacterium]|nr:cupin domain-containing protein [Anaerolineales bacterium]MDW8226606.1 cupin domain-containing protein [Anaerolineales bacterium]